jgi:hypothetical protein
MASQKTVHSLKNDVVPEDVRDHATDSGYGGSIADDSFSPSGNLFDKSFSEQMNKAHFLPSTRQQEIYQASCQLLTGSIEDTKHILKVCLLFPFFSQIAYCLEPKVV